MVYAVSQSVTPDNQTPPCNPGRHRLRKDPLAQIDDGERVRDVFKKVFGME